MRRISALLAVAAVIALAVFAGSASATPPPTPNGWSGACNMLNDTTMLPGSGGPMDKNNPNGNEGMFRAASVSGGNCG